jgi:hypothetical protein
MLVSLILIRYRCDAFVLQPFSNRQALSPIHADYIEAASGKLLWEVLEELQSQPVLNLSKRETASPDDAKDIVDTSDWDHGQRRSDTKEGLLVLDIISPHLLLTKCPPLYRLESSQVLQTAACLIQETGFDVTYVISEPRVLSYKCCDVEYGLKFI